MISLERRDARKGLGLAFPSEFKAQMMGESELEEGEACSYNNLNDDCNSSVDPDIDLSYIDEKLQDVLGHFQKDFEGEVSAENLGAKYGGYGSFLPTYQRSPVRLHHSTPPKVQTDHTPILSNHVHQEPVHRNSTAFPATAKVTSASCNASSVPASKASSTREPSSQNICLPPTQSSDFPHKKKLKLRIKVGSDNLSVAKNSELYNGLGLDGSPSSSLGESPSESCGVSKATHIKAPLESPTSIIEIMTSLPLLGGSLLSPLHYDIMHLKEKEKLPKYSESKSKVHEANPIKSIGKISVERKMTSKRTNEFSADTDFASRNNRNSQVDSRAILKKEADDNTLACEELISNTLKLPLLSSSCTTNGNQAKITGRMYKVSKDVSSDCRKDEAVIEVPEHINLPFLDKVSCCPKDSKRENVRKSLKANSSSSKGGIMDLTDLDKKKADKKSTLQEEKITVLPTDKGLSSSGGKKKVNASESNDILDAGAPKESARSASSLGPKTCKSLNDGFATKRESENSKPQKTDEKADTYREIFGDTLELEKEDNQPFSMEMSGKEKLRDNMVIEKSRQSGGVAKERSNTMKFEKVATSLAYPPATSNAASYANGPLPEAAFLDEWVACDDCGIWRLLPLGVTSADLPDKWFCYMLDWLPGMNNCRFSEEETANALKASYQLLPVDGQNNIQTHLGGPLVESFSANGSHHMATAIGKKSHRPKEIANTGAAVKISLSQSSNSAKKKLETSVRNGSLNDKSSSPGAGEPHVHQLNRPGEFSMEWQKDKLKVHDNYSPQGATKGSKSKSRRDSSHNSLVASKKIKSDTSAGWISDNGEGYRKAGRNSGTGMETAPSDKDWPGYTKRSSSVDLKHCKGDGLQFSVKPSKDRVVASLDGGSMTMENGQTRDTSTKKRKMRESQDSENYSRSTHLQDSRNFVKEEISDNEYRKEKKARISKNEGKEPSASKGNIKGDKKSSHAKSRQRGQNLPRSSDDMDNLKRGLGTIQPLAAATSSSSKVSVSNKSKASFHEVKGSPVESVSSSPMRADKRTSAKELLIVTDGFQKADTSGASNPGRCSDGENGRPEREKEKRTTQANQGSNESFLLDPQDQSSSRICENGRPGREKEKRTTQANQGSNESFLLDHQDQGSSRLSRVKAEEVPAPSYNGNRGWSNGDADQIDQDSQYHSKLIISDRGIDKKPDSDSKICFNKLPGLVGEPRNITPEIKPRDKTKTQGTFDVNGSRDLEKGSFGKSMLQDCGGKRSSNKFVSLEATKMETMSERGRSLSEDPAEGPLNGVLPRLPSPESRSEKGNRANNLPVEVSDGDNATKASKQLKNSAQHSRIQQNVSKNSTPNGHKVGDPDAPSPVKRDSSSQVGGNLVKEATSLKHMADRLKKSGSSLESTGLYFQACLKFLQGASLLESCRSENKHGEIESVRVYRTTAQLCAFCAHEYEKCNDMANAALVYKCMEVAYFRVIYHSHASANRDRHELQTALQTGESPSSSASDIDNLNQTTADKVSLPKAVGSPQIAGNLIIAARNRPNVGRVLDFTQNSISAMEASRKSQIAFEAAKSSMKGAQDKEGISSIKRALDFNFRDVEGLLQLVRLAVEAVSR